MTTGKVSYSYVDEYNGEKVIDDPNLKKCEKEVFIRLKPRVSENALVESDKGTIVKHLLQHDEAGIKRLRKYDGNIVGGTFLIPIGCVKIQKYSRDENHLSRVISK